MLNWHNYRANNVDDMLPFILNACQKKNFEANEKACHLCCFFLSLFFIFCSLYLHWLSIYVCGVLYSCQVLLRLKQSKILNHKSCLEFSRDYGFMTYIRGFNVKYCGWCYETSINANETRTKEDNINFMEYKYLF